MSEPTHDEVNAAADYAAESRVDHLSSQWG
jgi:hypothetical protein